MIFNSKAECAVERALDVADILGGDELTDMWPEWLWRAWLYAACDIALEVATGAEHHELGGEG